MNKQAVAAERARFAHIGTTSNFDLAVLEADPLYCTRRDNRVDRAFGG